MKAVTLWAAIILTAVISGAIGVAFGIRPDFEAPSIAKFFTEWQSLVGALTAIFTMGATLQAGWWALAGAKLQIQSNETLEKGKKIAENKAIRCQLLDSLDDIMIYTEKCIIYIHSDYNKIFKPSLRSDSISTFIDFMKTADDLHTSNTINIIDALQKSRAWIYEDEAKSIYLNKGESIFYTLKLRAIAEKWYPFSRFNTDLIQDKISREDLTRCLQQISPRLNDIVDDEFRNFALEYIDKYYPPHCSEL